MEVKYAFLIKSPLTVLFPFSLSITSITASKFFNNFSSEKLFLLALHDLGEKDKSENAVKTLYTLFQSQHKGNGWFEMAPSLEQYISQLNSLNNEGARDLLHSDDKNKKELYKD